MSSKPAPKGRGFCRLRCRQNHRPPNHPEFIVTFAVSVSASTAKLTVLIASPSAGDYQGRVLDSTGAEVQKATGPDPSFQFKGVAAEGNFTAEMSRLDVNGNVIQGSVVAVPFSTPADAAPVPITVDIDVPSTLTISVTQE